MRPGKNLMSAILSIVLVVGLFPGTALASDAAIALRSGSPLTGQAVGNYGVDLASEGYQTAINPYYGYRGNSTDGSGGECTWYAWGRAYEKLGAQLPGPGDGRAWHARYWADNCAAYGYPTGGEARADSIMVEDDGSETGHVYYVERVEGSYAYVTEGNYLGRYHEDAINLVTRVRDSWPGHVLGPLSYVYLMQDNPIDVAGSSVSLRKDAVKESAKTVSPFKVANAVTSYSFKDAGSSKYLSVGADGKVSVRKGTPAGTYTAKAAVHADGSARYKEKDVAVEAKVQVVSPPATPNPMFLKTAPLAAGFKASWKKVSRADGYEVAYFTAKDGSGKWSVAEASGGVSSKSVTGLRLECLYTVKVRAFARAIDGKSYYSGWCGLSNVKTKAAAYRVVFKANGGKGTMAAQKIACSKSTALAANKFKRSGYAFAGWNTKANGKGKALKNKAKVKDLAKSGEAITLYAQWAKTASYAIKTKDYTLTIPKAWRGEVEWKTFANTNRYTQNAISKTALIYLKGHKGDFRYCLAGVDVPTGGGFGGSVQLSMYWHKRDSSAFFALHAATVPYKVWEGKVQKSDWSYSYKDVPSSDLRKMLKLTTGGKVSYASAKKYYSVSGSDQSGIERSSAVVRSYLSKVFKGAIKSKNFQLRG